MNTQAQLTVQNDNLTTRVEENGDVTYYKDGVLIAVMRKEEAPSGDVQQLEEFQIAMNQEQQPSSPKERLLVVPGEEAPFQEVKVPAFFDDRKYYWVVLIIGFFVHLVWAVGFGYSIRFAQSRTSKRIGYAMGILFVIVFCIMLFAVILGGALSGKSGGNAGAFFGAFSGYNIIFTIGVYAVLYLITKYAVKNVLKPKQVPFESKKPEMVVASHEVHQTADDMMQDNA